MQAWHGRNIHIVDQQQHATHDAWHARVQPTHGQAGTRAPQLRQRTPAQGLLLVEVCWPVAEVVFDWGRGSVPRLSNAPASPLPASQRHASATLTTGHHLVMCVVRVALLSQHLLRQSGAGMAGSSSASNRVAHQTSRGQPKCQAVCDLRRRLLAADVAGIQAAAGEAAAAAAAAYVPICRRARPGCYNGCVLVDPVPEMPLLPVVTMRCKGPTPLEIRPHAGAVYGTKDATRSW
jgi:hypothetical protein